MKKRVTQKDVALRAGVSRATISLVFSNASRIPAQTREHVLQVAQQMGYAPDPMLASLAAYRSRMRPAVYHGVIAWLVNSHGGYNWKGHIHYREYYAGALERARQHGFNLEVFDLCQSGMNAGRMEKILSARNVSGILLCPQPQPDMVMDFRWDRFSALTFGYTLASPRLTTVAAAHYLSVQETVRRLRGLGYRRIGLASSQWIDTRMNQNYTSAYLGEIYRHCDFPPLPPLMNPYAYNLEGLKAWIDQYEPDAVVSHHFNALEELQAIGLRVPDDIGVACPSLPSADTDLAGMVEDSGHIGAVAVDTLVGMIQRGERGVPELPQRIHIEARWHQGKSLRAV